MMRWQGAALAAAFIAGCSAQQSQQANADTASRREAWVQDRAAENPVDAQRLALNGTSEVEYLEGWFPVEHDAERAWRWMGKRALVRLKLATPASSSGSAAPSDVALTIRGWLPHEYLGDAARELRIDVNGHRIDTFEAPAERFERTLRVPAALLDSEGRVELALEVANTVKPPRDERELGFATSGFTWAAAATPPR